MQEMDEEIKKTKKKNASARRKRKKKKKGRWLYWLLLLLLLLIFFVAAYKLVVELLKYYKGEKEYNQIKEYTVSNGDDFMIDWDGLLATNSDTVAWIRFDEPSVISYPVVKSHDNAEYLYKTFSANDNKLGAIFMDMRNDSSFNDRNTFIYGHHLNWPSKEMFSELNQYAEEAFCKQYPYFYIYTPDGKKHTYQVFSAGTVKATADNYVLTYADDAAYLQYLELCKASSNYQVDVSLTADSKIVSLSTCTNVNDDERFLLQGVRIESVQNQ